MKNGYNKQKKVEAAIKKQQSKGLQELQRWLISIMQQSEAGVAKVTLYHNLELKELIVSYRKKGTKHVQL